MEAEYDMNEIEKYINKYIAPHAHENMIKGLLLPYMSYEYLEKTYGEETAIKLKKLQPHKTTVS
jgi:oligoribonuclease NrnB/cAMP/cGMP phosphodiesterase (DHH superfamily)